METGNGWVIKMAKAKTEVTTEKYRCPYCPRAFATQRGQRVHTTHRHPEELERERQRERVSGLRLWLIMAYSASDPYESWECIEAVVAMLEEFEEDKLLTIRRADPVEFALTPQGTTHVGLPALVRLLNSLRKDLSVPVKRGSWEKAQRAAEWAEQNAPLLAYMRECAHRDEESTRVGVEQAREIAFWKDEDDVGNE